ncbi:hypothetical protein ABEB36_008549 [Hypothenemus hampei]|uniref:Uncharacterized protein n=1 Tax=Hypothenemus hampei TaxID=57062 RepID=A0ABD1EMV2_HYPHA
MPNSQIKLEENLRPMKFPQGYCKIKKRIAAYLISFSTPSLMCNAKKLEVVKLKSLITKLSLKNSHSWSICRTNKHKRFIEKLITVVYGHSTISKLNYLPGNNSIITIPVLPRSADS